MTNTRGKVSMVVPCYNKVKYIGAMLDSVIAQEWDNIEIILVNDGSTDGTREVIAAYEPKLKARGYEVVIVDQENAGCCAAVYAGLIRMSGEYFCLVDCDDEIEPQYVSHMAGWLEAHDDCDWAACAYRTVRYIGSTIKKSPTTEYKFHQDTDNLLEKYILRETITTVWIYMTRVSYIKKCGLIENFCTERRKTYEPLIMVPLAFGKGKLEFFNEPLYLYNQTALDLFRFDRFEKCIQYYDDYLYLYNWSISRLNASEDEKRRLWSIARLAYYREIGTFISKVPDGKDYELEAARSFSQTIDELFEPAPCIDALKILDGKFMLLFNIIKRNILTGHNISNKPKQGVRVIGYGALGKSAAKLLPVLNDSVWRPTELWDKNGDGHSIKKPNFDSLTSEDVVLLLPTKQQIINELINEIEGFRGKVFDRAEIQEIEEELLFPQLKRARLR